MHLPVNRFKANESPSLLMGVPNGGEHRRWLTKCSGRSPPDTFPYLCTLHVALYRSYIDWSLAIMPHGGGRLQNDGLIVCHPGHTTCFPVSMVVQVRSSATLAWGEDVNRPVGPNGHCGSA